MPRVEKDPKRNAERKKKREAAIARGKELEAAGAGRPTLYDPKMCEQVVEFGKEGMSITEIASNLGVDKKTVYNWRDQHPEFFHALTRAREEEQAWWEQQGRKSLTMPQGLTFTSAVYNRQMANRFPADHAERKEITGAGGGAIKTEDVSEDTGGSKTARKLALLLLSAAQDDASDE